MSCPVTLFASIATAKNHLARQLRELAAASPTGSTHRILRLEAPLAADCSPLQWLSWQNHSPRLYWSDRQGAFETAGVGCAHKIIRLGDDGRALSALRDYLADCSDRTRYYGGLRFDPDTLIDRHWLPYGACLFVLPQFEVTADATGAWLACNIFLDAGEQPGPKLRFLLKALEQVSVDGLGLPEKSGGVCPARRDIPERAVWLRQVEAALDGLQTGRFAKIVLSRSTALEFDPAPDPLFLLHRLKRIEPSAYHFYIQPRRGHAFLGASPECLYKREQDWLQSEALAGTCARGATPAEDQALSEALLRSAKERHEHALVRDDIKAILERCCRWVDADEPLHVLKHARVQHLYSRIHGRLRTPVADEELLRRLHPTPAVGGLPRTRALREIARLEPFDRGWFAGPVGWLSRDAAEFAVGIRSAVVDGRSLRLFAGAGIVTGSTPEGEWREIETKIGVFMDALGIRA